MCPFEDNAAMCTLEYFRLLNYKCAICKRIMALIVKHDLPCPELDIQGVSYEKLLALFDDLRLVEAGGNVYFVGQLVERLTREFGPRVEFV